MESGSIKQKMPEDFKRRLVACINKALQDDLPHYLAEFHPDTKNGVPHLIGDWINTNIRSDLTGEHVDVMEFSRYSWKGKVIIDRANLMTYTIMREKRLFQIRKERRDRPHYLQTIVSILNNQFEAQVKQLVLFDVGEYRFDEETLDGDYDSIFNGCLGRDEGFTHCAIAYDTFRGELSDIKVLFLDKDLDVIEDISLNEYIKPDFAALTNTPVAAAQTEDAEARASTGLLSLRKRDAEATAEDTPPPARLREFEKQA
jgi:hypothetical protein